MNKLKKLKCNPLIPFARLWMLCSRWIKSDSFYLRVLYYCRTLHPLNLKAPKRFTEKLQWLKLYYNKTPLHSRLVDKYEVREYVENKIGMKYLIPLLGCWDNTDDIDFSKLPEHFVLKTTHDSGGVWICRDKQSFISKWKSTKKLINKRLRHNYYLNSREYPYRNVRPRIIAEKFMVDESGSDLKDYKFFCFDGEPKFSYIASQRFSKDGARFDFYDINLKRLPFSAMGHLQSSNTNLEVEGYDEMLAIVRSLSNGFPHVRIDLYNIKGQIYFGEFTFHHEGGLFPFQPIEWDIKIGD